MNLSSIKELRIIKTDTQFERTNYRVLASYTDIGVYSNGYVGNITTASEHSINDALKHFNELSDILVKDMLCFDQTERRRPVSSILSLRHRGTRENPVRSRKLPR